MPHSFYQRIGGEHALRELVDRFYTIMAELPDAGGIRAMHPDDMSGSADKLFKFLSGWSGGPDLYIEEFGHPRLRRRHMPIRIGNSERDQWMHCMDLAMQQCGLNEQLHHDLYQALYNTADFMRNQAEGESASGEGSEASGSALSRLRIVSAKPD
jgi:hemoglobin